MRNTPNTPNTLIRWADEPGYGAQLHQTRKVAYLDVGRLPAESLCWVWGREQWCVGVLLDLLPEWGAELRSLVAEDPVEAEPGSPAYVLRDNFPLLFQRSRRIPAKTLLGDGIVVSAIAQSTRRAAGLPPRPLPPVQLHNPGWYSTRELDEEFLRVQRRAEQALDAEAIRRADPHPSGPRHA
jgi:hypothetical protein